MIGPLLRVALRGAQSIAKVLIPGLSLVRMDLRFISQIYSSSFKIFIMGGIDRWMDRMRVEERRRVNKRSSMK
jgi:hypothetical protein